MKSAFLTVTDHEFFPGTVATINSIARFHPELDVFVIVNHKHPLTDPQLRLLHSNYRVRVVDSRDIAQEGWFVNAWELKAYGASKFLCEVDVLVGIDSDCMLCSSVSDLIAQCHTTGWFLGGADGDGKDYDESYSIYGFAAPARNPKYMSTSLFFAANSDENRRLFEEWCICCNSAVFNGTGEYPGHGDQGILNAILFSRGATDRIALLDNHLVSQHWTFWGAALAFQNGQFVNLSADGRLQRSYHCPSGEKFWVVEHRNRVLTTNAHQIYPYIWFLGLFWFGRSQLWSVDPWEYLPEKSRHLVQDLIDHLPHINQLIPESRETWSKVSKQIVDRALDGIRTTPTMTEDSLHDVVNIVCRHRTARRFVEVRSYEGRTTIFLALHFSNRDIDFYSIESFTDNSGKHAQLERNPNRKQYIQNMAMFPTARARMVPGDTQSAATAFDNDSLDLIFINGIEDVSQLRQDIQAWRPKLAAKGIIFGDGYHDEAVRNTVNQLLPEVEAMASGIWWCMT